MEFTARYGGLMPEGGSADIIYHILL